ncbi:MAG: hypothetical protein KF773_12450 [Deltaproteobacteria bacterium]|nr:hypothetical protein [Deltaproteobacteria bacterium]
MEIRSWTDGYLAILRAACESRGVMEELGVQWPSLSGGDTIVIAALFDAAVRAHATPGVLARWFAALDDVERHALAATHGVFPESRAFCSSLEGAAVLLDALAVEPPAPRVWDAAIDALWAHGPRNAESSVPVSLDGVDSFTDLYLKQFVHIRDVRGFDKLDPEPGMPGTTRPIPRSTNSDVVALADYWTPQLEDASHINGASTTERRWKAALADVETFARRGEPTAVYAKNNAFWRELANLAAHISAAAIKPSRWDIMKSSFIWSIKNLPNNLATATSKGAEIVTGAAEKGAEAVAGAAKVAAKAAGEVLNQTTSGLASGLATPLIIGGVGVLGLYLLTRNQSYSSRDKQAVS